MTEMKGQTYKEKHLEALTTIGRYKDEYSKMNPVLKTSQKKLQQIQKLNGLILELEPKLSEIQLSETCIKQLIKIFAQEYHGRREELKNKYLDKGNYRENDAITVLARNMKKHFKKNATRLRNKFLQGEPDLYLGESINNADETLDTKCSWSLITFLEAMQADLNPMYEWQGHGYMDLTGAKKHTVVYCLVNGTFQAINDEIRKTGWQMGVLDASVETDPVFVEKVKQIERNHIFNLTDFMNENQGYELRNDFSLDGEKYYWDYDIPLKDRIHTKTFDRDDDKIKAAHERVIKSREWMNRNLFKITNLITS